MSKTVENEGRVIGTYWWEEGWTKTAPESGEPLRKRSKRKKEWDARSALDTNDVVTCQARGQTNLREASHYVR